jgi:2'-5' RNA ligase
VIRVFTALPLPTPALERLEKAAGELRRRAANLRVVHPEGLHVTLIFLGELEEGPLEDVKRALADPSLAGPAIEASLGGLGQFPPRGTPRVLYCSIRQGAEAIRTLHARLREALLAEWNTHGTGNGALSGPRKALVPAWDDRRPFTPHVTVARSRGGPVELSELEEMFRFEQPATLDRLVLFQSILKPEGAEYRPLKTVRFMGES